MSLIVKVLQAHQALYERSGGLIGHRLLGGMPTLLLHTVGRKTGQPRTSALSYGRDGDEYLVVASNGGAPKPPAWFFNVGAEPECEIQIGRARRKATARTVLPGEPGYERMWDTMNKVNHGQYREYQKKTTRPIAIVALKPT